MRPLKAVPFVTAAILAGGLAAAGHRAVQPAHIIHPVSGQTIVVPGQDGESRLLFNGWRIHPTGRSISSGDMPLGGAVSPDGSTLAIANSGYNGHAVHFIDLASEKEVGKVNLLRSWSGIAWAPDGSRLYISAGVGNPGGDIYVVGKDAGGAWSIQSQWKLAGPDTAHRAISGLALSANGSLLFVVNDSDNRVYTVNTQTGETVSHVEVGDHPLAAKLSPDGKTLFVTLWGGSEVAALDESRPESVAVVKRISTGAHPNDLAFGSDGRLFASCGNADAVTVIDTTTLQPIETIRTALTQQSPEGAEPDALALTPDGKTLFVANSGNNDVCVVDVSERGRSRVKGFIPTGWYPTAVVACPDGKRVVICSGKGTGTGPNLAKLPINPEYQSGFRHIAHQLNGLISFVDIPDMPALANFTHIALDDIPYHDAQLRASPTSLRTVIPTRVGMSSPIKHILYVIKENRTYDQVFGDLSQGNSDPSLCLFGRDVSPNHHALAEQFVLLDNLYCNGEVSADGHPWSTSAQANDFVERSWLLSYSRHGDTQDTASVNAPQAGYIWDACARKGLTYRSYGEYVWWVTSSDAAPMTKLDGQTGLKGHGCAAWEGKGRPKGAEMRDMDRADVFCDEFKQFEQKGTVPTFMIMSLGEDHTEGTRPGAFTPKSKVASNDQALGHIVDVISHSKLWKQFAIFVIEDDAQNGPDHVDAHRTVGLVISPYVKRHAVDSTMYSTASMLRTMELLLGLPPMSQYDAAATPMYASFTDHADLTPYTLIGPKIDLAARNPVNGYGARQSARMDWREYDRIPEDELNSILWHSIKGVNVPMPPPVHGAFLDTRPACAHASSDD